MPRDWKAHLSRARWGAPARAAREDETPVPCGDTLSARIWREDAPNHNRDG